MSDDADEWFRCAEDQRTLADELKSQSGLREMAPEKVREAAKRHGYRAELATDGSWLFWPDEGEEEE
jgi:hypothetical protein